MPKQETVGLVLTIDDEHLSEIDQIAGQLQKMGVHNIHTSPVLGTITGEAPNTTLSDLRHLEGVMTVEQERLVRAI